MQTERVTFLTSPDHKAALDAFARGNGMSIGHVVREATSRYLAEGETDDEEALVLLTREVEAALPKMRDDIREAIDAIAAANSIVADVLDGEPLAA